MDLIHLQGSNCYHDCVMSIVNHMGIDFYAAFVTLWSESDFRYDPYREAYLTKRMISNLNLLGAKVKCFDCFSYTDAEMNLSRFNDDELMIVGMDAFYIPWNPFHQTFHGPHYFIVQNAKTDQLICYDPTYNKKNEVIAREDVIARTFDVCRITRVDKGYTRMRKHIPAAVTGSALNTRENPLRAGKSFQPSVYLLTDIKNEAQNILFTHTKTRQELLARICNCIEEEREKIVLLAKYIDAMMSNRYFYRLFLESQSLSYAGSHLFFDKDFFLKWAAVKNGLYKASMSGSKESIINDVCRHFSCIIDKEVEAAEKMISNI